MRGCAAGLIVETSREEELTTMVEWGEASRGGTGTEASSEHNIVG